MRISLLTILLISFCDPLLAQLNNEDRMLPSMSDQNSLSEINSVEKIDTNKRFYVKKILLNQFAMPSVKIINTVTKSLNDKSDLANLPDNLNPTVRISIERKQAIAYVYVPRYFQQNGQVNLLASFDMDIQENVSNSSNKTSGQRVYAANSVLATGAWKKIAVNGQGVYKMDYSFFKNELGLDPDNIDPRKIGVFGHGGEALPENNAIFRYDDLPENAIEFVGEADGRFDANDYILFYANGPHSIIPDYASKSYTHSINTYTDESYFYITVGTSNGKRIVPQALTAPANLNSTKGDFFQYIEPDSVNLGKSGKNWWSVDYSDNPGRSLSRTFTFPTPNLDATTPVKIKTSVSAITSSGTSYFSITANGSNVHTHTLDAIGFSHNDPVSRVNTQSSDHNTTAGSLAIGLNFTPGNSSAIGYLDYIEISGRRTLSLNKYLRFSDWQSVGTGNVVEYEVNNTNSNTKVWDISSTVEVVSITPSSISGSTLKFKTAADSLRTFLVFDGSLTNKPVFVGGVNNQNIHAAGPKDYIIISHPDFLSQANRLADYHASKRAYRTLVVTPQEIYNEFSSGSQDVSAIRDFIKMFYDKASQAADIPNSVLFFGDASYEYKNRLNNNTNFVPTYQTNESISKITSYCTDDFFGFLDDIEDINNYSPGTANTVDVGIGRIPCQSITEATNVVNKIIHYDGPSSFGPWKNVMLFNADDEDINHHLHDAETMSAFVRDSLPNFNVYKNYIDAYSQQSTPAGPRTPDAATFFKNRIFNGTFLVNYNGHGGPLGWCEERILTMDDINEQNNLSKLPLYITATCDFTQFDNPSLKSAGEELMLNPKGGAIALMTTTRLVFIPGNGVMNYNYFKTGFQKINGAYPTLGDSYRLSKNVEYVHTQSPFDAANYRKFNLIGDPGLPLSFPKNSVVTDSINGVSVLSYTDTLKALGKYTISGHLTDEYGNPLSGFNGTVYPTVIDKSKVLRTLGNDPNSYSENFSVQNNILYNGKASVVNGKFSFTFVVPKDINYNIAKGKISYYAHNDVEDANGYYLPLIGGSSSSTLVDNVGPTIQPFLNDERFVNGGITKSNSLLLVKLFDENGINYTGNSVGHDITAILDNNPQNTYVLNTFYESELDNYQKGIVRFPVNDLAEGPHTLTIKAWDVFNNSSEAKLDFVVVKSTEAKLDHVYNYPNPFSTNTRFMFEHNMPNENLFVSLKIFSVSGSVVKNIQQTINTPGTRFDEIFWDGKDQYGDKLGNGVYLYQLSVKGQNGFSDQKIQKLIILR